jgi:hypothetical protein
MTNSICRLLGISLLSLLLIANTGQKARAQDVEVSFQTFYDNLSPYGEWVSDPEYGDVWVPNEAGNFRPYGSRGHWVMTDVGNTWVSDDPWGWACYHYGRWTYDAYYGWVWIPGYEWAPAWVTWRYGGGYSGWAPLGPNVSLSYNAPESWWIFVQPQYMYRPDCIHYWRGPQYNRQCIRQTAFVDNYYTDNRSHAQYNYGPRREAVERYTHQPVQVYRLAPANRAGRTTVSGQQVNVFRPEINRNSVREARPANEVRAPHPIGAPQQAVNNNRAPAFRQEVQQRRAEPGYRQPNNQPQQQPRNAPQAQPQQQPRNFPQQQPQGQPQQQPRNFPQQQGQPQQQPRNFPQQQGQPQREQPRNFPQQQPQGQPQREPRNFPQQQPQGQPQREQPRNFPQQQPQGQPQREQPRNFPQQQVQPQREQRPFQAPPRPQMQAPQQQPRPQMQPQRQAPPQQQPRPQMQQQPQRQAPAQNEEHGRR